MLLIRSDGTERTVDGRLTVESLQFLVGGYFEHVVLPDGRHMFVDEDGKHKGKPVNVKATNLYMPTYDIIVGDALILTADEFYQMTDDPEGD